MAWSRDRGCCRCRERLTMLGRLRARSRISHWFWMQLPDMTRAILIHDPSQRGVFPRWRCKIVRCRRASPLSGHLSGTKPMPRRTRRSITFSPNSVTNASGSNCRTAMRMRGTRSVRSWPAKWRITSGSFAIKAENQSAG